jgi:hypothetical protein
MVSQMPAPKELERLGGLFKLASDKNRPFLSRCAETKYLAVKDYDRATNLTFELARQTLSEANAGLRSHVGSKAYLAIIRSAVESGQLDSDFIGALKKLRAQYLQKVLRPAVKDYLNNNQSKYIEIEKLYNDALRIEGLLEVAQFLKKLELIVE